MPIKVTFPHGTNPYSIDGYPFNIEGWGSPSNDAESHWCFWSLAITVMELSPGLGVIPAVATLKTVMGLKNVIRIGANMREGIKIQKKV